MGQKWLSERGNSTVYWEAMPFVVIPEAATIWPPSPALAGLSFFLLGVGPILWVISTTTLRQSVTPRALLGRVSAINSLAYGARPIGAVAGALVGGAWGAKTCPIVCAAGFLSQMLVIFCSQVPITPAARVGRIGIASRFVP